MPRIIVKFEPDLYCEWSTVVDAPVTYGMTLKQLRSYVKRVYGNSGLDELPERLKRVDHHGTSLYDGTTVDDLIKSNRAGENEKRATKEQIITELRHK
jgi:hypothetical protein